MSEKIESLLAKFGCKGQRYGEHAQGTPLFSVDEQLAMVGISWRESPAGWNCLMFECNRDQSAYRELLTMLICEVSVMMQKWRGPLHGSVLRALSVTAIAEITQPRGVICGECKGASKALSKGKLRKCPACHDGHIKWNDFTRYAIFSQAAPIQHERFIRYIPFLTSLVSWLSDARGIAIASIQKQLEKERLDALKVA